MPSSSSRALRMPDRRGDGNPKMSKKLCAKLQELNTPLVTEGLQYMQKAVDIRP